MPVSEAGAARVVDRLLTGVEGIHAVLFYGPEGGGMVESAMNLVHGWLCPNLSPASPAPCGECGVCRAFARGQMVDFMHVKPWGPANLIKQHAVRRTKPDDDDAPEPPLIEFFRAPPLMARTKVVLFEQADRMNVPAASALLKSLEEPPPHAKVVLTTAEFSKLLPTVRSRCMAVACGHGLTPADDLERVFGGSPGLARQVQAHREPYSRLWSVLESSLSAPSGAAIALAERSRESAEGIGKALGLNARGANAEALRCTAEWLIQRRPDRPDLAQAAVESHRLVLGNIHAGALFDVLWARIVGQ